MNWKIINAKINRKSWSIYINISKEEIEKLVYASDWITVLRLAYSPSIDTTFMYNFPHNKQKYNLQKLTLEEDDNKY